MTIVPLLYSDKKIPLQTQIKGQDGCSITFPDNCYHINFREFDNDPYKNAVEQEIKVIRPILPEYEYYLSIPNFIDKFGNVDINHEYSVKQAMCINEYLKKMILTTGAELMFMNVCLGDDYECIDDFEIIKFDLNRDINELKVAYRRLFDERNIVKFVLN